jgi:hypothetical protein
MLQLSEAAMTSARLLIATLLAASLVSSAQTPNKFDGSWKSLLVVGAQRCSVNLVMGPEQRYSEIVRCGSMMTRQAGSYTFAKGVLIREVADWDPKQRYVLDTGYRGHYEPNAKPPGGTYKVDFPAADTMVWHDVNFGGTITFRRVH